ncbi:MAG: hypothetical protein Ct9H300mP21_00990 [Pseudomonadota bacterium]|nr:MAG: hypothetical protein Ct9H300mP21_00990 [Pseudomonadota bacterium]
MQEWFRIWENGAYAEMIPYGIPSLFPVWACAPLAVFGGRPLEWEWNVDCFFYRHGLSSILTGFAQSLLQIGFGLAFFGVFASIYHPVG